MLSRSIYNTHTLLLDEFNKTRTISSGSLNGLLEVMCFWREMAEAMEDETIVDDAPLDTQNPLKGRGNVVDLRPNRRGKP